MRKERSKRAIPMPHKDNKVRRKADDVDARSYNQVVSRTSIRSIRLLENKFEMKPDALELDPSDWHKSIDFQLREVVVTETGGLFGMVEFALICKQGRKHVLTNRCRYLVHYVVEGACSQTDGETFIDRVGRIAVYPYFRSTVATLVSEAGIQMPPLPVYSLAPRSLASAAKLRSAASGG